MPIQVLIYCFRRSGNSIEFLFLKRSSCRGGFWQGVTGAPIEGESLVDAAKRELLEETGITPISIKQLQFSYSFPVDPEWQHLYSPQVKSIDEYVFVSEVEGVNPILSNEHECFLWQNLNAGLELLKYSNNKTALIACRNELGTI